MARTMKSYARAAGSGLALASMAALPLCASAQQQTAAAPVKTNASQVVVRDAVSGQLRAATAEEAQALNSAPQFRSLVSNSPATSMTRVHWSGARGARVTDEFATYSVLVKQPDGSLKEVCVEGRNAADAVAKAPAIAAKSQLPTE